MHCSLWHTTYPGEERTLCANRSLRAIPSPTGSYWNCIAHKLISFGKEQGMYASTLTCQLHPGQESQWCWERRMVHCEGGQPAYQVWLLWHRGSYEAWPPVLCCRDHLRKEGWGEGKKGERQREKEGGQLLTYNHTEYKSTCQLAFNTCTYMHIHIQYTQLIREYIICETEILPAARQNSTLVCLAKAFPTEWIYTIRADIHVPTSTWQ